MSRKISGLTFHCHHGIMIEYCYDYAERLDHIKKYKSENEIPTRVRLFKMLSRAALKELPANLSKAYAAWSMVYADWSKAYADWSMTDADWSMTDAARSKAYADWLKTNADLSKAYADWSDKSKEKFHARFCGCKEWNGHEIIFPSGKVKS